MTTRRDFLAGAAGAAGALAAGVLLPRCAQARAARDRLARIGVQLYTVRAEMQKDVAATLARVAQIGYKEVEFAGYFGLPPERARALLDQNGLRSPSVHLSIELLEREFAAQAASAKALGQETLVVPSLPTRQLTTVESWRGIARRFNAIGEKAHDAGLRFAFHNHASEVVPVEGVRPLDLLLEETHAGLVDFQMDLYWMVRAGGDPIDYFNRFPARFHSVHVKDATPAPELAMRDVGAGAIPFGRIFALSARAGIRHYYVEHDSPGADPFASIERSYRHLANLEF